MNALPANERHSSAFLIEETLLSMIEEEEEEGDDEFGNKHAFLKLKIKLNFIILLSFLVVRRGAFTSAS